MHYYCTICTIIKFRLIFKKISENLEKDNSKETDFGTNFQE